MALLPATTVCGSGVVPSQNWFVRLRIHCVNRLVASMSTRFEPSGGIWTELAPRVAVRVSNTELAGWCGAMTALLALPKLLISAPSIRPAKAVGVVMRASQFACDTVPAGWWHCEQLAIKNER